MEDPRQYLNDNEEALRLAMENNRAGLWTAMPAIVQSVNLAKMTCVVQLAIQGRYEDQQGKLNWVNISKISDVPICFPSAGGFTITFPMAINDEVLVIFASKCIDAWWQNGGYLNKPMEYRMHDLSDGFAIPGPKSLPNVLTGISATDIQIRNKAGTTFLSIGVDGKIGFANATTTLKTVLNNFESAVNTFATSCGSATSVANIAAAGTVLSTSLTAVATAIGALLK
jgi:hypothetical protein